MISTANNTSAYTDLAHLTTLKAQAKGQTPEATKETAQQFEALFLQMMIKSMREAGGDSHLLDGENSEMYWELYDKQLAMDLSAGGGVGLADIIYRQLGGEEMPLNNTPSEYKSVGGNISEIAIQQPSQPRFIKYQAPVESELQLTKSWQSPDSFIQDIYPAARKAADALGTEPEAILSVAALETGWGRSVTQANGQHGNNLFGIKADAQWRGAKFLSPTLEFEQGSMQQKKEAFRAYPSPEDSVSDFVQFIQDNPRYKSLTEKFHRADDFVKQLKLSGYATDPDYDKKLLSVMNGSTMKTALNKVKDLTF